MTEDKAGPLVGARLDDEGILTLTLNRPRSFNALSMAMIAALREAFGAAFADPAVRVIVLAAEGRGFCGGHDLKELHAHRADPDGGRNFYIELFDRCSHLMMAMTMGPKVIIARVQGVATAAGGQLVASCDMAVASDAARFGVNGISSGLFCSTPMVAVSRAIGRKKAMELLTTGRLMEAAEALEAGLINAMSAPGELEEKTRAMARMVAEKSAAVVALGKQAFYRQAEMNLADAYAYTRGVIMENLMMHDSEEGICAFVEKRQPKWTDS